MICKGAHPIWRCESFKRKTPTQRAKIVADARLCFSCLDGIHSFRNCPQPRKCKKENCTSTHSTFLHGAERVFSNASKTPRASNAPDDKPKVTPNTTSLAAVEKDSTSNQTPKTSAGLPSVTDIKGLLQVKTIEVVSGSGESCKVLALIDSACSHSWMSISSQIVCH